MASGWNDSVPILELIPYTAAPASDTVGVTFTCDGTATTCPMIERLLEVWREALAAPLGLVGVLYIGRMAAAARAGLRVAERRRYEWAEAIFHIGRARPKGAGRWKCQPRRARFPTVPLRDVEYAAFQRLGAEE